jgi:opacity protein-like surface antigen
MQTRATLRETERTVMTTRFMAGASAGVWFLVTAAVSGQAHAQIYDGDGILRFGVFGQGSFADLNVLEPAKGGVRDTTNPEDFTAPLPAAGTGSLDGGAFGVSYGYDVVRHDSWIIGIEGDVSIEFAEDEIEDRDYSVDFMSTVRGRIGAYVRPGWLVYATGGLALLGVEFRGLRETTPRPEPPNFVAERSKISDTLTGWTVGAGTEFEWRHIVFFGEYLFADYDTWSFRDDIDPDLPASSIDFQLDKRRHIVDIDDQHVVRLGVKFKIGHDFLHDYGIPCCGPYK